MGGFYQVVYFTCPHLCSCKSSGLQEGLCFGSKLTLILRLYVIPSLPSHLGRRLLVPKMSILR